MKPYKIITLLLITYFAINPVLAYSDTVEQLKTVDRVDLNRYMGTWYEIAKIPNRFQKDCTGDTKANYTLLDSGKVEVTNSCLTADGKTKVAKGVAKVEDPVTNAKLKVSFFSIFGLHLFWGNYWILYLDDSYQNVIVGEPERKYGWILSRKQSLTEDEIKPLYEKLTENGYDPGNFELTPQNITR